MGMFDYLRCDAALPDDAVKADHLFQTKDFNCEMATHVITADGRLMVDQGHREMVPENERPYPNGEGLCKWMGSMRWVPDLQPVEHHGYVNFYTLIDSDKQWIEYNAKFTDGRLVEIKRVPPVPA